MLGKSNEKELIGRAEKITFLDLALAKIPARIDTGAKTSAIWASKISVKKDGLHVVFLGKEQPFYDGVEHVFESFEKTVVASSNGASELRYKVKLLITLKRKKIRAYFTLANRAEQVYPVLIGRNVLSGRFIVDVQRGTPLVKVEKARTEMLKKRFNVGDES